MKKPEKDDEITFEQGLARLEKLVQDLESEDLNLDRSLALFEDGIKLARTLNRKLDEAEKKLTLLIKDEEGNPAEVDFELTVDEGREEE